MTVGPYQGEVLAQQLGDDALGAILGAKFNGYGWAVMSPASETRHQLIGLKLANVFKGELVLTVRGMKVRSVVIRRAKSSQPIADYD